MKVRRGCGTVVGIALAAACGLLATTLAADAQRGPLPPKVAKSPEVRVADNVFLVPDGNARSVTGWLIVKAGCADEADGNCTGIAHYLEHLLFINRDSDNRSKVALFPEGAGNGWTSHRATTYLQRFPAGAATNGERLDKLLGYFAGLLTDVRVDGPQAERERNVVLQEYQQNTGRNPFARFAIDINLALMPRDPLGQRVIGSPATIAAFSPEAARAYHARWYTRANAIVVLHGPIDPGTVKPLVARHFGQLPERKSPANAWKAPRRYPSEKATLRTADKEARQIAVSLDKIVTFDAKPGERGALLAAQGVLSSYLASRLKESPLEVLMERDGLVTQGRLGISMVRDGALRVSFSAVPADGVAPEKVVDAARAWIADLARRGLDRDIVERLKTRIGNERNLLAEQPGLYAQSLVSWFGSHLSHENWRQRVADTAAVTSARVDRLIRIVAAPGREVVGIIVPEAGGAGKTARPAVPAATRDSVPPLETDQTGAQPQAQP